jgi:asparagine synthase (glutamine-hydrolysing)
VPDPASPFRAIKKLMPGCWLQYDEASGVRQGRYWKLPLPAEQEPLALTRERARMMLREKFDEAVRIRMIADVPLGAFLSGGIDSSSVVASMALQSPDPVKTFSIGFEEAAFNELDYARAIAGKYKTEHHEIVVHPDSVDLVSRLVKHFDEPFADSSAIPTYIVSEFARQHVKVALSGDGGDELFAGYESFFQIEKMRKFDAIPLPLRRVAGWVASRLPYAARGKNYLRMISRPSALERYFESNYTPYFLRRQLLPDQWMLPEDRGFLLGRFVECLPSHDADVITQALYFEATAKLTGDMLVKVDRMSMANSLEVRCPLLDHPLAEFAAGLPHRWKMSNGTGKAILLEALGDRLPPALLRRAKMGFGVPLSIWFRGPLRDFLSDHLLAGECVERGILSAGFVRYMIEEHQSGRRDNYHWLWGLLMLELWLREWQAAAGNG